jgi:hypothetical protein
MYKDISDGEEQAPHNGKESNTQAFTHMFTSLTLLTHVTGPTTVQSQCVRRTEHCSLLIAAYELSGSGACPTCTSAHCHSALQAELGARLVWHTSPTVPSGPLSPSPS